jgi:MFS family permease
MRSASEREVAVTAEEWVLAATVFLSGLASGLLGMLSTIMRPMLAAMDGRDFRNFMEAFLRFAGHSWGRVFNYAWSIGMTIGPVVALVLLWDDPGSISFALTAIGLGIVIVGVLIVSNVWKTPTYNVILGWDLEAMPADWEAGRQRYFTINWIQLAVTWAAFALFLVALVSL